MRTHRIPILGIAALFVATACSTPAGSWRAAQNEDTPGAYHRFLREHPGSAHADEARERLAFAKLRQRPTAEAYDKFRRNFPDSTLMSELKDTLEAPLFERARLRGSAEAYRAFLAEFPDGALASRAAGNIEYLERRGFGGDPRQLAAFAERHPESDFAAEARRSGASIELRSRTAFRRVGLVIEVDPATPGRERLARAFAERVRRQLARTATELVVLASASDPRRSQVSALITVRHHEAETQPDIRGKSAFAGIAATTQLVVTRSGDDSPIWTEQFGHRVSLAERKEDESIVFGVTGDRYWDAFYVPRVDWSTQTAVRETFPLPAGAVAVRALGQRAVVLFHEGHVQLVDLSDPARPLVTAEYRHPRDLSTWHDLRVVDGKIALFGDDGIVVIDVDGAAPKRLLALDRSKVGSVVALERVGNDWLIAGSQGLLLYRPGTAEPRQLFEMNVRGAAVHGQRVFFTDGSSLFEGTVASLSQGKAQAHVRIGKRIGPERVRISGNFALVMGDRDVLLYDVSQPGKPKLRSRVTHTEAGEIADAAIAGGRLFVLGSRGLQVLDRSARRIAEAADVTPRERLAVAGRHLVMIGDQGLQVVDTTPFVVGDGLASPRR